MQCVSKTTKSVLAHGCATRLYLLEGLVAVSRVTVEVVVLLGVEPVTLEDNFLALEVVGFMKLWLLAEGVVRRALAGLEGVSVAEEVILMGLERMLGVE